VAPALRPSIRQIKKAFFSIFEILSIEDIKFQGRYGSYGDTSV
jgi:hypothetical protein